MSEITVTAQRVSAAAAVYHRDAPVVENVTLRANGRELWAYLTFLGHNHRAWRYSLNRDALSWLVHEGYYAATSVAANRHARWGHRSHLEVGSLTARPLDSGAIRLTFVGPETASAFDIHSADFLRLEYLPTESPPR